MITRIQQLIEEKKMTATQFSDEVGVQRSSLSHVLSGRNNPSLDFMLKIKNRFPEIRLDWLLLGEGEIYVAETDEKSGSETEDQNIGESSTESSAEDDFSVNEPYIAKGRMKRSSGPGGSMPNGRVDDEDLKLIVLVNHDDTFRILYPDKKKAAP